MKMLYKPQRIISVLLMNYKIDKLLNRQNYTNDKIHDAEHYSMFFCPLR